MDLSKFKVIYNDILEGLKKLLDSLKVKAPEEKKEKKKEKDSFRFVVMGDSRGHRSGTNEAVLRQLLRQIKSLPLQPEIIIFNGDMVEGGHKAFGLLEGWKAIADDYYPVNKYYTSLGNHDGDEESFDRAFSYLPGDSLKNYRKTVYYFDYGNARFVVLNSNRKDSKGNYVVDSIQRQWLNKVLSESKRKYNFVIFHVPAYGVGHHYKSSLDANPGERDALWKIIDKYNAAAVFTAHEHNYNRRLIDREFSTKEASFSHEIYQITTGGAGAPLNSSLKDSKGLKAGPLGVFHYLVVDVNTDSLTFNVFDINNKVIDSFRATR